MGRLIDADAVKKKYPLMENDFGMTFNEGIHKAIDSMPIVEAIPKADYEARLRENNRLVNDLEELRTMINKFAESYENRLKANMVAMLTELQLEIAELKSYESADGQDLVMLADIGILFQQKINNLQVDNSKVEEQNNDRL